MKKALTHFFSLLLALFLLVSSMGLTLNKMICLSSGKVTVSLLEIKHCGPDEKDNDCHSALNTKCCDISSSYLHVNIPSVIKHSSIIIPALDALFTGYTPNCFKVNFISSITSFPFSDFPPPIIGKDFLNLIRVLRI